MSALPEIFATPDPSQLCDGRDLDLALDESNSVHFGLLQVIRDWWKDQPRAPKGSEGGGRWTPGGGQAEIFGPSKAKVEVESEDKHESSDLREHRKKQIEARLEELFHPGFKLQDVASIVGAPDYAKVTVSITQRLFTQPIIIVKMDHGTLTADRMIGKDNHGRTYIENEFISVPRNQKDSGLGTHIFGQQVEQAAKHGAAYIKCMAARSSGPNGMNGYYTWPRLGYDAPLGNLSRHMRGEITSLFPKAKTLLDVMSTSEGRKWWKENGNDVDDAVFDLSKGSRSQAVLHAYLDERRKSNRKFSGDTEFTDHWLDQPRAPEGSEGGGRWVSGGVSFGPSKARVEMARMPYGQLQHDTMVLFKLKTFFGDHFKMQDVASVVGAPDDAKVTLRRAGTGVDVTIVHPHLVECTRMIDKDDETGKVRISNEYLEVRKEYQNSGIGAKIFARQVEQARKHGVSYIKCFAVRADPDFNGYYTWPRFGYDQAIAKLHFGSHPEAKAELKKLFPKAKTVLDVISTADGRKWWKQNGVSFSARFDLSDNSRSLAVLGAYLHAKEAAHEASRPKLREAHPWRLLGPAIMHDSDRRTADDTDAEFADHWKNQTRAPKGSSGGGRWVKQGAATEHEPHPRPVERFGPSKAETSIDYEDYWSRNHRKDASDHAGYEKEIMGILHGMFGKKFTLQDVASVVGAPDDAKVTVERVFDSIAVSVRHPDFVAERSIQMYQPPAVAKKEVVIRNNFIEINKDKQKSGLGTRIFGRQVEQARKLGVSSIRCYAVRDDKEGMNGYYTWPRLGFDAKIKDLMEPTEFGQQIKERFPKAKTVLDIMSTADGRKWWKEHGCPVSPAVFDLKDKSRSLAVLEAYHQERERKGNKS